MYTRITLARHHLGDRTPPPPQRTSSLHMNLFRYEPLSLPTPSFTNYFRYELFSFPNFFHYEPFPLRTFSVTNFISDEPFIQADTNFNQYEPLHTNLCLRTFFNTNLFRYELPLTNFLHTNFLQRTISVTNILHPNHLRTIAVTNLIPYELYPIRTFAYEPFLMNLFL